MPLSHYTAVGSSPRVSLTTLKLDWRDSRLQRNGDPDEPFVRPCDPLPLENPTWCAISDAAAALVGLNRQQLLSDLRWRDLLSGSAAPDHLQPYAAVYAGHQFGVFVPRLGDGRALGLGCLNGWELQLKGAGPTPYARFADGRAVLRSSIREFLCSEAMHALGIPTTRALSLIRSSTPVVRETLETAAVVCRLSPSFIRFGHFEYFASINRLDLLEQLVRHALSDLDQEQSDPDRPIHESAIALLTLTAERTARLMAQWMAAGFMHGVMNTDNFSILGLTIDYGPFGFMEAFNSAHICNHSDHSGRYRYEAQPQIGLWNIARLCGACHGLIQDPTAFEGVLETYKEAYAQEIDRLLRQKFGLQQLDESSWTPLLDDFYRLLQKQQIDYPQIFRALASDDDIVLGCCPDPDAFQPWLARYREAFQSVCRTSGVTERDQRGAMNRVNPKYVLRNWIAEEVITEVRDTGKTDRLETIMTLLATPFDEHPGHERYAQSPPDWARDLCVSCSS